MKLLRDGQQVKVGTFRFQNLAIFVHTLDGYKHDDSMSYYDYLNKARLNKISIIEKDLLVLHEHGMGKRAPLSDYSVHRRFNQGVWTTDHRRIDEVGPIVAARVVYENDQITVITAKGIILRTPVAGISRMGRSTRGVRVVNLQKDDSVAALAVLTYDDLNRQIEVSEDEQQQNGASVEPVPEPSPESAANADGIDDAPENADEEYS